jgi:serine/threonine-protein kinase
MTPRPNIHETALPAALGAGRWTTICRGGFAVALVVGAVTALAGRSESMLWLAFGVVLGALELSRLRRAPDGMLGPYTLDEKVGEGGMGVVYKAHHALLPRPAAIKLLAPHRAGEHAVKRFEREVKLTSRLSHPNTISIYDFGRAPGGAFYCAMEFVDGLDLQTLVERHGPQPPARVAHLLAQVAGALAEAHAAGLIHRDVKPANVMVCERGGMLDVVKVLDFGLVKEMHSANDVPLGDGGRIVGTPLYLSPEAVAAPESVDARSDLYALGALGYFLLTGSPPFAGKNAVELCLQHLHSDPVPPSVRSENAIPRELEALVMGCLSKSRDDRPQSAALLQTELLALAAEWTQGAASNFWAHASEANDRKAPATESGALDVLPLAATVALAA